MSDVPYTHIVRFACTVLEELRTVTKELNPSTAQMTKNTLFSLIEELQIICNRMEAGLELSNDIKKLSKFTESKQKELGGLEISPAILDGLHKKRKSAKVDAKKVEKELKEALNALEGAEDD